MNILPACTKVQKDKIVESFESKVGPHNSTTRIHTATVLAPCKYTYMYRNTCIHVDKYVYINMYVYIYVYI